MEGQTAGKVEVDEGQWRSLLELAMNEGKFSEHQTRNIKAWLKYDWSTLTRSKVRTLIIHPMRGESTSFSLIGAHTDHFFPPSRNLRPLSG